MQINIYVFINGFERKANKTLSSVYIENNIVAFNVLDIVNYLLYLHK